jgi:hypothetical protein
LSSDGHQDWFGIISSIVSFELGFSLLQMWVKQGMPGNKQGYDYKFTIAFHWAALMHDPTIDVQNRAGCIRLVIIPGTIK